MLPGEVTRLLQRVDAGDRDAIRDLLPVVYEELRALAAARMAGERHDHTLQAAALVHEAWARMVAGSQPSWTDRRHFFRAAATVMRHILIDHSRERQRVKRAGGAEPGVLEPHMLVFEERSLDMLALHEALSKLEVIAPRQTDLIELRFFAGLTREDAAEMLGISARSAYAEWRLARAWLLRGMEVA